MKLSPHHDWALSIVCVLALLSFGASAQQVAPGTSRQHCSELGGQWEEMPSERWYGQCWFDWSEEKCHAERADWIPRKARCTVRQSYESLVAECNDNGGTWGENPRGRNECNVSAIRLQCANDGGEWFVGGPMESSRCLRRSRDGGAPCTGSNQCELRCLAPNRSAKQGSPAVGYCQRQEFPGCGGVYVENGIVSRRDCIN